MKKKKRYTMVVTYLLCSNENQVVRVHGVGRVMLQVDMILERNVLLSLSPGLLMGTNQLILMET